MRVRSTLTALAALVLAAAACGGRETPHTDARADSALAALHGARAADSSDIDGTAGDSASNADTSPPPAGVEASVHIEDTARVRGVGLERIGNLSPLADSIASQLTFLATFQTTFIAASRAKRLLMDIGRVDAKLGTRPRLRAYQQAVKELSPVKVGERVRLHGPWGSDDAAVTGYGQWNGRIVATLKVPRQVDSLARLKQPLVALAVREDSAPAADSVPAADSMPPADSTPPPAVACGRDSVDSAMVARVAIVRDSLLAVLTADTARVPERLRASRHVAASQSIGCFGSARVLLFANAAAGANEYTREIAVLVDTTGKIVPLRVADVRFRVHEALRALDVDGDGVDDIAAIGRGERTGGTVLLRLDLARRRLMYVTSGFAWESY